MSLKDRLRARARTTDPETSHAAAASISEQSLRDSQALLLDILRRFGPLHDEEILKLADGLGSSISASGCRTRRSELVSKGFVRDSGRRFRLPSGRQSIVWEAVP